MCIPFGPSWRSVRVGERVLAPFLHSLSLVVPLRSGHWPLLVPKLDYCEQGGSLIRCCHFFPIALGKTGNTFYDRPIATWPRNQTRDPRRFALNAGAACHTMQRYRKSKIVRPLPFIGAITAARRSSYLENKAASVGGLFHFKPSSGPVRWPRGWATAAPMITWTVIALVPCHSRSQQIRS